MKTFAICSCGFDAMTWAHWRAPEHEFVRLRPFNDGQQHSKEAFFRSGAIIAAI